jgi:hypothetical protein
MGTIARFLGKIKSFMRTREFKDGYIIFLIIISGFIGFLLGRISTKSPINPLVTIKESIPRDNVLGAIKLAKEGPTVEQKPFLASKNGTKYYPINCSSANRILEENRIWFDKEEDAITQGYEKSTTCK